MFSYNKSIHEGTKCTHYELLFGKIPRLPPSVPSPEHGKLEKYDIYMIEVITKLHQMCGIAKDNLITAKKNRKFTQTWKLILCASVVTLTHHVV